MASKSKTEPSRTIKMEGYGLEMQATVVVFRPMQGGMLTADRELIAVQQHSGEQYDNLRQRFGWEVRFCTPVGFDDGNENFYAVFVTDCFDPPIAIVRADDEEEAIDRFTEELSWARPDKTDLDEAISEENAGGDECLYQQNDGGTWYDPENLQVVSLRLVRIECE